MKNTLKYVSAFAVAGALVACDSSTSSDGGSPYGATKYSAPIKQGNVTGRCDVYATSSSVTKIASAEAFGSTIRVEESGTWNADGSYQYRGDYITITESYTGVDTATLQTVCDTYKSDAEQMDVVCDGAAITSTQLTEGAPLESIVSFYRDGVCPAFLSGNLTLEEMWFDDFE